MSRNQTKEKDISLVSANFGLNGWGILILTFLCIFLDSSLINDSLNVVVDVFANQNGWNSGMLYGFSTITAWIAVAGAALWGVLSSKISIRWSWAISLLITGIACLFWGHASSPAVYFVCLAVSAVGGMGFCYICSLNVVSNWFPRKKGIAMGWVTIGFPLSAAVTSQIMGNIVTKGGLPEVYTIYAVASFVLCVLVALFVRDYPEQAGAYPDNNHKFDNEAAKKELAEGLEYMKNSPWTVKKLFSTGKVWLNVDLIEYIMLIPTEGSLDKMLDREHPQQEYLDREDEYVIVFFFTQSSNGNMINVRITINGWTVRINNIEM